MSDFNDLMNEHGEELSPELQEKLTTDVVAMFYTHEVGEYKALFSELRFHYKDADKKKCEPDKPGAKLTGASARFILLADPKDRLILDGLKIDDSKDLGRLTYNHYISLKEEDQWKHAKTFADFIINEMPEAGIVQEGGKKLLLQNLQLFVGIPVTFEIVAGKKETSRFSNNFLLQDHATLTREKIEKRKGIIKGLEEQLKVYSDRLAAERLAKTEAGGGAPPVEEAKSDDDFLLEEMN
jgi:hypothetical protein